MEGDHGVGDAGYQPEITENVDHEDMDLCFYTTDDQHQEDH